MIFPFLSTLKVEKSILKVDMHSHLIPGIDDGAKDIDESLLLLKGLSDAGYEKVITTPHIMLDSYRNGRDNIMEGLQKLQEAALKRGIDIIIEAGAEYYLDDGFEVHLKRGNLLTLGDNYILFETSYVAKPLQFEEMVFAISSAGYQPVLAHPERYRYIQNNANEYKRMQELGIIFQVNINSLGGHYGKDAQKKALFLSKEGMIGFLGSDIHHYRQIETLIALQKSKTYQNIFRYNTILNDRLF
ncbi:Capsular polysaccharide synthesis enzyme Cap8C; Manganese-dependent protein-tyrosine phosphatase [hydrothermal vent metagenome]|uniref:Capsular polysaccharide synthesis enzyme Cap8C Manganese-dependent protein-tyrosine phosphatase n=1 Tax=hydrothermal vent metagenome TaxID=652676 RepID=A0A1W1C2R5_9ZZZZ